MPGDATNNGGETRRCYVYVLFDFQGMPRYVGKGTGNRWLQHELRPDNKNSQKNRFIEETTQVLGEVPKVKFRENLTETEAFALEVALIDAIGRHPHGPLCNFRPGGDGLSSQEAHQINMALSAEERRERARKGGTAKRFSDDKRQQIAVAIEVARNIRAAAKLAGVSQGTVLLVAKEKGIALPRLLPAERRAKLIKALKTTRNAARAAREVGGVSASRAWKIAKAEHIELDLSGTRGKVGRPRKLAVRPCAFRNGHTIYMETRWGGRSRRML
jgi:hypothetical protein